MSELQGPQFHCSGCKASYRWKPELAGKKAKCKCGQVMEVPAEPDEGLYDLVDEPPPPRAGSPTAVPSASVSPAAMPAAAAAGRIIRPVVPYASAARQRPEDEELERAYRRVHFYLPMGLILAGTVLALFVNMRVYDISLAGATLVVGIKLLIDLVLIFGGCLLAIKLMDFSLGAPAEAILKLCAIAIAPGALAGLIELWVDPAVGLLVSFLMLGVYFILLKVFFDLDGGEVMMLSVLIWLIRTWVGYFLAGVLLLGLMTALSSKGGANGPVGASQGNSPAVLPADTSQNMDIGED